MVSRSTSDAGTTKREAVLAPTVIIGGNEVTGELLVPPGVTRVSRRYCSSWLLFKLLIRQQFVSNAKNVAGEDG